MRLIKVQNIALHCRRTVKDKSTGQGVVLSDKDMDLVERFKKGKFIDSAYDPYEVKFATHWYNYYF